MYAGCESFSGVLGTYLADLLSETSEYDETSKAAQLKTLKMNIYLLVEMMRCFEDQSVKNNSTMASPPKGRKQTKAKLSSDIGTSLNVYCLNASPKQSIN